MLEQSLARFISPEETREFTAALPEVVERGVMRNVVLNPRSASDEVIPTSLNASALRDPDGRAIGVIGILRDMRELDKARAYAESLISDAAAQSLLRYSWRGNVRELRNVIRRAILVASDVIEPEHLSFLPVDVRSATAPREEEAPIGASLKEVGDAAAADAEQHAIRRVLQGTKGNKSEAARLLRTDYKTLHLKMKQYGIPAAQFRDAVTGA